ncbi:MAG: helix-turn-helix domain-containing protein [archaeon]
MQEELMGLGLTEGEAKVYLALNKIGNSTIGPIVDESGVSRSKIYDVLDRLMRKGLASYMVKDKTKYFQANEPSKIIDYLDNEENRIRKSREKLSKVMPLLIGERGTGKDTSVQVYEGFEGIMTAHDHVFTGLRKGDEYFFYGIPAFQEERYHERWNAAHRKRVKLGIRCRMLFNPGTPHFVMENRNSYKGSEARYMPSGIETPAWIMVYRDVSLIGLQSRKGMAIEIVNPEIAESFRIYFEMLWDVSAKF